MFEMDRQGFEILAMGFTGEEALRWKFKYSDAFAAMDPVQWPCTDARGAADETGRIFAEGGFFTRISDGIKLWFE